MLSRNKFLVVIFVVIGVLMLSASRESLGQSSFGSLTVEKEQHWDTYLVGGTCIYATHNIAVADLDGDGEMEITTGGFTYDIANGTRVRSSAPLKIWNWNGQNLTLEASYKWPETAGRASITCVAAADINHDGQTNLLTGGGMANESGFFSQVRIWRWDGKNLALRASKEWNSTHGLSGVSAAIVVDADNDGAAEIVTAGGVTNTEENYTSAQLRVWRWVAEKGDLELLANAEWRDGQASSANSLCSADVDNDGQIEIVTAGYNHGLANSSAQLRVWRWNGKELSLRANMEWRTVEGTYALNSAGGVQGNTYLSNVKAGDVDGDGAVEIVTGGFTYTGEAVPGQLRIWNWTAGSIVLEKSSEWTSEYITEVKAITLNDVDADGQTEIVTSGVTAGQSSFSENATLKELAQLKVWSCNGAELTLEHSEEWTVGEGVCAWNVASGDVDRDGTVEIVTVGCMYVTDMCDPDMRIWSVPRETLSTSESKGWQTELAAVAVACIVVIILATAYLLKKRHA
ncbi:MAG: FG-GAP repeat domain-containing protein [Candidatus Bathyarchaeia archaeon]